MNAKESQTLNLTRARIEESLARANAATEGPWEAPAALLGLRNTTLFAGEKHVLYHTGADEDRDFIAEARSDVPAMAVALLGVLDMHKPRTFTVAPGNSRTICVECCGGGEGYLPSSQYPCATVRAIFGTEPGGSE